MAKRIDRKVIRGIIYKQCSRCREYHPESEFNRRHDTSDHLQCYCRVCNAEYCKKWAKQEEGRW